ncbi:hypothetical protein BFF94_011925 [Burkholderia catarinensis]|nr:hypothetical protein BFF94_011925 [Burkholderia catarinensis]
MCEAAATGGVAVGGKSVERAAARVVRRRAVRYGMRTRAVEERRACGSRTGMREQSQRGACATLRTTGRAAYVSNASNVFRCAAKGSSLLFMIARAALRVLWTGASSMRIR